MVATSKKLLVLDVNGLLIDTYFQAEQRPDRAHDAKVNRFYVYRRNGCEDFVQFCVENFVVGVWSSAREHNVLSLVKFIFKESMDKLAFIWHQVHCTDTKLKHPENRHKPVFLKELSKLWDKSDPALPWEKGDFGPSNTVLIDDSPYKALRNPPHSGVFPESYKATDPEDNYLVGELRTYLEGLLRATDVQVYIKKNPLGMPGLARGDEHYEFFSSVLPKPSLASPKPEKVVAVANSAGGTVVTLPDTDVFATSQRRRGKKKFGSTAEESLEYCAAEHVQSPRDFSERLSRAVDVSRDVAFQGDPLLDTYTPVADGVLGTQPRFQLQDKRRSRIRSMERHAQPRDTADASHVQHSGRRASVISADNQWSTGGIEPQQGTNRKEVGGNQWIDTQQQYLADMYAVDAAVQDRWYGNGEWRGRAPEWNPRVVQNRHRGGRANQPVWLNAGRPGHSPLAVHTEFTSRGWVQSGSINHPEDNFRRGWARDNRSSHGSLSPYTGRLGLQKNKAKELHRGKQRDHMERVREPEIVMRAGPRVFENVYGIRNREHVVTRGAGAREYEDMDRSYARPPFTQDDGYARGRSADFVHDKNPQPSGPERVRVRPRHHEAVDQDYKRQSNIHDARVGGALSHVPHSEYDGLRKSNEVPRTHEDKYVSKPRNGGQLGVFDSGPSEPHVRRGEHIAGRSGQMSSRHFEQAHSRPRNSNKWER